MHAIANFIRYGWPRRRLLRLHGWLPSAAGDRLLDFLYPDDCQITFK